MTASHTALGLATLALLVERPMHPYEMYQVLLQRRADRLVKVRPGSLYHTVHWLEAHGFARPTSTEREGNRPERTIYEITAEGEAILTEGIAELLATPANEFPAFPVAIAEAHNLPRETVVELLGRRLALLKADLDEIDGVIRDLEARTVDRMYWLNASYLKSMQSAEIRWLEQLLSDLRGNVIPWPENSHPHRTQEKV